VSIWFNEHNLCASLINSFNVSHVQFGLIFFVYAADEVEFDLPSSSKRKKNREEISDQLPKKAQKKIYRPKVFSQIPTNKSQAKSSTPKPSTPKRRKRHIRRGASCTTQLFNEDSSIANNELGIEYNSVQSYQNVPSLSSLCLLEGKQIGPNFPLLFKKKRVLRKRVCLQQFLTRFEKGVRSKSFIRKRRHCINFSVKGGIFKDKKLKSRLEKIRSLMKKGRKSKELVVYEGLGEMVPYKKRSSLNVDVLLDEETSRVWTLLKEEKGHDENDEMKKKYWENIRKIYKFKVASFIEHMHVVQGMFCLCCLVSYFILIIFIHFRIIWKSETLFNLNLLDINCHPFCFYKKTKYKLEREREAIYAKLSLLKAKLVC